MSWRDYQDSVAAALAAVGCQTRVEEKVRGARATHKIDVCARFCQHGITQLWIVECKALRKPVTKEKVLVLQQIVADVGADRGLLFCEVGFQAGAVTAARSSNITLTSLGDFKDRSQEEREQLQLRNIELRCADLQSRYYACQTSEEEVRDGLRMIHTTMNTNGIDKYGVSYGLGMLDRALEHIRLDGFRGLKPRYQVLCWGEDKLQACPTWSYFYRQASSLLDTIQFLVEELEQLNGASRGCNLFPRAGRAAGRRDAETDQRGTGDQGC
jgi:hypothetical protein